MKLAIVILAAGRGTRMKSDLPKALHSLCGRPMLGHLLEVSAGLSPAKVIVVAGFKSELVRAYLKKQTFIAKNKLSVVVQKKLLGSGHAVGETARDLARFDGAVIVLYCDTPLLSETTIKNLIRDYESKQADASLLSVVLENPLGYGRIVRKNSALVERIVEENDANPVQKDIREVNVGSYIFDTKKLFAALKLVRQNPKKKEYYLTDAIEILANTGKVSAVLVPEPKEVLGINTRLDLCRLEGHMREKILLKWLDKGVLIQDPKTTFIDLDVKIGSGTVIHPNTVIEQGSIIGSGCSIGPFARVRGASVVGDGSVIGNFVEVVRSKVGKKTFVKHLSYIGDALIGSQVNIGAGTITANYDGLKKHKTIIKDKANIGSGTILVAPVTVGKGAKTGAGAVVTKGKNVPDRGVVVGVPAKLLEKGRAG